MIYTKKKLKTIKRFLKDELSIQKICLKDSIEEGDRDTGKIHLANIHYLNFALKELKNGYIY